MKLTCYLFIPVDHKITEMHIQRERKMLSGFWQRKMTLCLGFVHFEYACVILSQLLWANVLLWILFVIINEKPRTGMMLFFESLVNIIKTGPTTGPAT